MILSRISLLLVSDCCLYFSLELRGDLPNPVLFCVLRGIPQHFLFRLPSYNMCASGRWINLGALNDFPHGSSSLLSPVMGPASGMCKTFSINVSAGTYTQSTMSKTRV